VLAAVLACAPANDKQPSSGDASPGDFDNGDPSHGDATGGDSALPDGAVWGWISAIEMNDVCDSGWYLLARGEEVAWFGGLRAYFALEPSYPRSLPHDVMFAYEVGTYGDCTLYDAGLVDVGPDLVTIDYDCMPDSWCQDHPDTRCLRLESADEPVCVPLPAHWSAGAITIEGMTVDVSMTPDSLDRYLYAPVDLPEDLFDAGDTLTAKVAGDEIDGFTVHSDGVAHLETPGTVDWYFPVARETEVTWTPADDNARVHVTILGGSHDPNPLTAAIVCDAPDSAGKIAISEELMEAFNRLSYMSEFTFSTFSKCHRITRYTRSTISTEELDFQFYVGSARNLALIGN
jgi:hypothetical protein